MKTIRNLLKPFIGIVFPETCVCCRASTAGSGNSICSWCRTDRFESSENRNNDILPASVQFFYSMWLFDKGGYLQKLLHDLKYHYLMGVGEELGFLLGKHFLNNAAQEIKEMLGQLQPVIIPVPLHKNKIRKRGYNQARAIAVGVQRATGWDLSEKGTVLRVKSTKTQTGLSLSDRAENLRGAFSVNNKMILEDRFVVLVDDVYTTGATTFELAGTLLEADISGVGILTVAKA